MALAPQSLEAVTNLAMALRNRGRLGDAERWYRRALELSPGAHHLQADLAQLLRRQGRAEEALQQLRQAAAALPEDGAVRATLYHDLLRVADWGELPALGRDIDRLNEAAIAKGAGRARIRLSQCAAPRRGRREFPYRPQPRDGDREPHRLGPGETAA